MGTDNKDILEDTREETSAQKSVSLPITIGAVVAALLIGGAIGHFAVPSAGGGGSTLGTAAVAESDLDKTIATFSSDTASGTVTIREAALDYGPLDSFKDEAGNYRLPPTETIVSCARNKVLMADAKAKGIEVDDDKLLEYAHGVLGGESSFEELAEQYGLKVDEVKSQLRTSATLDELRKKVLGDDASQTTPPEAPNPPESDSEEARAEKKKEYADYIIKLAGSEWDESKGGFKAADGAYASALKDYEISADGASYDAASEAYSVAYQQFGTKSGELSDKWTEYVNSLMKSGKIEISSLISQAQ